MRKTKIHISHEVPTSHRSLHRICELQIPFLTLNCYLKYTSWINIVNKFFYYSKSFTSEDSK